MSENRKELSEDLKEVIVKLHCEGKSLSTISKTVGKARSTVQYVVRSYATRGTVKNKQRPGRQKVLDEHHERQIIREIKKNPKTNACDIAKNIRQHFGNICCDETVRNILRKNNYNSRTARKKPWISEVNRKKRITFAKEHIYKDETFWNGVIFSDESKYNIFGSDGKQKVWRKPNQELKKENISATVKHGGGSVMVWGCMSAFGVGELVFIDSIMDRFGYLDILKTNLKKSAEKLGLKESFIFQHDNDPKHTSHIVKEWLLHNVKNQLNTPPQSPDLNPIEHLWDELQQRIRMTPIKSKTELKARLQEEWEKIDCSVTQNLVGSMNRRLKAVIEANGNPTKY